MLLLLLPYHRLLHLLLILLLLSLLLLLFLLLLLLLLLMLSKPIRYIVWLRDLRCNIWRSVTKRDLILLHLRGILLSSERLLCIIRILGESMVASIRLAKDWSSSMLIRVGRSDRRAGNLGASMRIVVILILDWWW